MAELGKVYWSFLIKNNSTGAVISDAIPVSVDFPYGQQAGLTEISLPRKHDTPDTMTDGSSQANSMGNEIEISVNGSTIFTGIIRSIYPSLSGTDQRVNLSVSDYRARMNEKLVEKDNSTLIIWNKGGEGTVTIKDIIEYIFDNGYVSTVTMPQTTRDVLPDVNMGEIIIQDLPAGQAINFLLNRAGNYRWWVDGNKQFQVYKEGTGDIDTVAVGFNVINHSLRDSMAEVVNDIWVIGAKKQYQVVGELLSPAWDTTLTDAGTIIRDFSIAGDVDTKNAGNYNEVNRKWKSINKNWLKENITTHLESGDAVADEIKLAIATYDTDGFRSTIFGINGIDIAFIDYENGIVYTKKRWDKVYATYSYETEDLTWKTGKRGNAPYRIERVIDKRDTLFYQEILSGEVDKIIKVPGSTPYEVSLSYTPILGSVEVYGSYLLDPWPVGTIFTAPAEKTVITGYQVNASEKKIVFDSTQANANLYLHYHAQQEIFRDDSVTGGKMETIGEAEVIKNQDAKVSGSVTIVGDENKTLGRRLNITSDTNKYANINAEVIKITHSFSSGFQTVLQLNNEEFIPGQPTEKEKEKKDKFELEAIPKIKVILHRVFPEGFKDKDTPPNTTNEYKLEKHIHDDATSGGELNKTSTMISGGTFDNVIEWSTSKNNWVSSGGKWVAHTA